MGNTKSGYTKQPSSQVNNEPPPSYEEYNTMPLKIPALTKQPIKLNDLKREEQQFAAEQTKAYEDNYVKICDDIIEFINNTIRNRNKQFQQISINIRAEHTTKYIPNKLLSAKLTKLYLQNYKLFVCEMYKDFKIEISEQIGFINFRFHIPE
jgi:hypothetical protein